MVPRLAHTFGDSVEELIDSPAPRTARKREPTPMSTLQRQMERISAPPKPQQKCVLQVLGSVLQQQPR